MRRKVSRGTQVYSVALPPLDFALMDFIVETVGPNDLTRSIVVRRAIEHYVAQHDIWDPASFQAFAQKRARDIKGEDTRKQFLIEVEQFIRQQKMPMDRDTLCDVSDLNIATSRSIFEF